MARKQTSGCSGRRHRYSMIVDVTHSITPLCVGGAVAIERVAFSARLTSTRFFGPLFEIPHDRTWTARWDLTWRKDVLEPGESSGGANYHRADKGGPITTGGRLS
jgi:hypothetical protein